MKNLHIISGGDIIRVIEEAFFILESTQSIANNVSGWHQYLGSGKIGNIATSQVLDIYLQYEKAAPNLQQSLDFLLRSRINFQFYGEILHGWSYASSGPPIPCVEPTCWAYFSLQERNVPEIDQIRDAVYAFIVKTKRVSEEGVSWGFTPFTEPRITATCIAIHTLLKIGDAELAREGIRWLLSARENHNGWGPARNSLPTVSHTGIALTTLLDANYVTTHPVISDGITFLRSKVTQILCQVNLNGNNECAGFSETIEIPSAPGLVDRPSRISYYYNPLAISALTFSKFDSCRDIYFACIVRIVNLWDSNKWKHRYLRENTHCTSWSIYNNLISIKQIKNNLPKKSSGILSYCTKNGATAFRIPFIGVLTSDKSKKIVLFVSKVILLSFVFIFSTYAINKNFKLLDSGISIILSILANFIYAFLTKRK